MLAKLVRSGSDMQTRRRVPVVVAILLGGAVLFGLARPAQAQEAGRASLDLTIRHYGLSIGNAPRVNGVRLNYRDRGLVRVNGVNLTLWGPHDVGDGGPTGTVNGLALGVPATGAATINGVAFGLVGVEAHRSLRGLTVGGLGAGAGGDLSGVAVGGLGMGTGGRFTGLGVAGLGLGAGDAVRGLVVGGLGVGAGQDLMGIAVGGLGAGAGTHVRGVAIGGLGVGTGGRFTGLGVAGLGVGAGEALRGLFAAGAGLGAPAISGLTIASATGSKQFTGMALAPAYFRIADGGRLRGAAVSTFNHIKGTQHGLTIGLFNYARVLQGVQLGVLNYAGNNPRWLRLLPGLNVNR